MIVLTSPNNPNRHASCGGLQTYSRGGQTARVSGPPRRTSGGRGEAYVEFRSPGTDRAQLIDGIRKPQAVSRHEQDLRLRGCASYLASSKGISTCAYRALRITYPQ